MTKKHFEMFASWLAMNRDYIIHDEAIDGLMNILIQSNPKFDEEKFADRVEYYRMEYHG